MFTELDTAASSAIWHTTSAIFTGCHLPTQVSASTSRSVRAALSAQCISTLRKWSIMPCLEATDAELIWPSCTSNLRIGMPSIELNVTVDVYTMVANGHHVHVCRYGWYEDFSDDVCGLAGDQADDNIGITGGQIVRAVTGVKVVEAVLGAVAAGSADDGHVGRTDCVAVGNAKRDVGQLGMRELDAALVVSNETCLVGAIAMDHVDEDRVAVAADSFDNAWNGEMAAGGGGGVVNDFGVGNREE
eukprot:IDg17666t1